MGEMIGGRYRLESQLGAGGMAEVWVAHDTQLDRTVAVKLLGARADPMRFEREAHAVAGLSHPNISRLFDYGSEHSRPYMVFEHLSGGTLEDRFVPGQGLADETTARIAGELASGLAHAHEHGLVHRDLKPANVLFDEEGRAKIADFGIARMSGADTLTEDGTLLGTAAYMSPEQAAGRPVTPASDVYAFGVLLYRMLSGRLPFESPEALQVARQHLQEVPPPLSALRPDAPPVLAALAEDALAKDPSAGWGGPGRSPLRSGSWNARRSGISRHPGHAASPLAPSASSTSRLTRPADARRRRRWSRPLRRERRVQPEAQSVFGRTAAAGLADADRNGPDQAAAASTTAVSSSAASPAAAASAPPPAARPATRAPAAAAAAASTVSTSATAAAAAAGSWLGSRRDLGRRPRPRRGTERRPPLRRAPGCAGTVGRILGSDLRGRRLAGRLLCRTHAPTRADGERPSRPPAPQLRKVSSALGRLRAGAGRNRRHDRRRPAG